MYDCRLMISRKKLGRSMFGLILSIFLLMAIGCASMSGKKDANPEQADFRKRITNIKTVASDDSDRVVIHSDTELTYTSVKQHAPLGLLLLFPETTFNENLIVPAPESDIISTITASRSSDLKNTRIEVGLKSDLLYEVKRNDQELEIIFMRPDQVPAEETQTDGAVLPVADTMSKAGSVSGDMMTETPKQKSTNKSSQSSEPPIPTTTPTTESGPSIIDRIDFSSKPSGKSMIIVGTNSYTPIVYDLQKINDQILRVRIFNSRLPEYRRNRPLITTRFESAVDRITPIQAADMENATDLIIELRENVPYQPVAENNELTINFDSSSIGPRPFASANLPSWQQVMENAAAPNISEPESGMDEVNKEESYEDVFGEKKEYTGQKIALHLYKADIRNVFNILQEVSGKNYAIDQNVTGEFSGSISNPAPWDQILDLVLRMNGLGKEEKGNIIRIATKETLSAEEESRQKLIQAYRERKEQEKTLEPLVTEYLPINYANAQGEVLPHIEGLLTKDRGSITVDGRNNQIIMTDTLSKIRQAREIITEIDKVTPQVLIEARIVEMSDDFSRELGIEWSASGDDIYRSGLNGQYSYNMAMNLPGTNVLENRIEEGMPGGTLGVSFQRLDAWGTPVLLDATLRTMEREGQGKIISSPKVLTLDNKKAMIRQGVRIPFTVIEDGSVEVNFQDVDLLLEVTPHITPDKRVSMEIKTTKNEIIGYADFMGYPIISTNEAETVLLVDDGETIVIGGVSKTTANTLETGFPVLKDIPMLGWLFKTDTSDSSTNELLVFLTPRIVQLEQKKELVQAQN
jgi:type IV pilus assembly protein PilQ